MTSMPNRGWWPTILPHERRCVAWTACWFFCILLSYFIIRPVRETMGTQGDESELSRLFVATFFVMLAAVPAYSALVARLPRRWLVRVVYHFFCGCLVFFWFAMQFGNSSVLDWTARIFFVWVNVFGLFATSVFWSVLTDIFSNEQSKRLFGLVATGGTVGAIVGSLVTSVLVNYLGIGWLLLLPVVLLQIGLCCAWRLERNARHFNKPTNPIAQKQSNSGEGAKQADTSTKLKEPPPTSAPRRVPHDDHANTDQPTGGGLMSGITQVLQSPYLATICLYLFLVQALGTHLYFQQASIVAASFDVKEHRTQWFANLDLATQLLTLFFQAVLASSVLRKLGVGIALALLPAVYIIGLGALSISPQLITLSIVMVATRAISYGITVPSREVLFTVVSREQKYKAKSFVDTVVLRGGDAIASKLISIVRSAGLGTAQMNWLMIPVVLAWAVIAIGLGRMQRRRTNRPRLDKKDRLATENEAD